MQKEEKTTALEPKYESDHENELCQCCRCRNKHLYGDRIEKKKNSDSWTPIVCPKCSAESYFNLSEEARLEAAKTPA